MSFEANDAPMEFVIGGVRYVRADLYDSALSAIRIERSDVACSSLKDIVVTLRRLASEHKIFRPQTRSELNAAAALIMEQSEDLARYDNCRVVLLGMIKLLQEGNAVERVTVVSAG